MYRSVVSGYFGVFMAKSLSSEVASTPPQKRLAFWEVYIFSYIHTYKFLEGFWKLLGRCLELFLKDFGDVFEVFGKDKRVKTYIENMTL